MSLLKRSNHVGVWRCGPAIETGDRRLRLGLPLVAVLSGGLATACTPGSSTTAGSDGAAPDASMPAAVDAVFRGHVVFGHEVRSFESCDSETLVWASDPSGRLWTLYRELATGRVPYEAVFAVVRGRLADPPDEGFGADYPGQLVVSDIDYMADEGFGCEQDWSAFAFRASGNEPFWSVSISQTGVRLSTPGEVGQPWTAVRVRTDGPIKRYDGTLDGGRAVELEIARGACRDSMSGAFFGWTSALRLGPDVLRGCAVSGDGEARPAGS